jgi:hypothetical protein
VVAAATGCLAVVLVLVAGDEKKEAAGNTTTKSADTGTEVMANPATFPELNFHSSGRLPINLHGLRLGMSVAEAVSENPDLKNNHTGHEASPASDPSAELIRYSDSRGFFETASFSNGRLTLVDSSVEGISPGDASQFDKNTLVQLGEPDKRLYVGSSAEAWLWIDGDVRIRYDNTNVGKPFGSRTVALSIVVYPELIKGLVVAKDSNVDPHLDANANLELNMNQYGEDLGEVQLKQLPAGLSDIPLRMTASQVRAALPGINLVRMTPSGQQGTLTSQNVTTDVAIWNGHVSFVHRTWDHISIDQAREVRDRLMESFGTPSAHVPPVMNGFESITWEDDRTEITYMFSVISADNSHQVQAFYYDKELRALSNSADAAARYPEEFTPSPQEHSFF